MADKPQKHKFTSFDLSPLDKIGLLLMGPFAIFALGAALASKRECEEELDTACEQQAQDAMKMWRRNRKPGETEFTWSSSLADGPPFKRTYSWTIPEDDKPIPRFPKFGPDFLAGIRYEPAAKPLWEQPEFLEALRATVESKPLSNIQCLTEVDSTMLDKLEMR